MVTERSARRCVICAAAPVDDPAGLAHWLRRDDFIIAADGGQWLVEAMGRKPDYLVADFDSRKPARAEATIPVTCLPTVKDDTDTMAAARLAVQWGFTRFLLLGVAGGRLDHTLANLAVMDWLSGYGEAEMADGESTAVMCRPGRYSVTPKDGAFLSLLPYGGPVTGITLKHVGYPLENATLETNYPLGISNVFIPGENAEISFQSGHLLIFTSKD